MSTQQEGYNRDTLLEMLKLRIVEIKFRKANGEFRVLRGTLLDEYLPKKYQAEGITPDDFDLTPNLITLWDVDANDWRSIRIDRIEEVL